MTFVPSGPTKRKQPAVIPRSCGMAELEEADPTILLEGGMPRFASDSRPISATQPIIEFYREEFVKHHRCLQQQRPYYSESAITDVETALIKILGQLEQLSTRDNAPQLVSSLLKKFDVVTGLSAWSDPKHSH